MFSRTPIFELASSLRRDERASFIVRYKNNDGRRLCLHQLSEFASLPSTRSFDREVGSTSPSFRLCFDMRVVLRALMKLGMNLLAAYCPNTPVNRDCFRNTIEFILDEVAADPTVFSRNGFVDPSAVQGFRDFSGHAFRLQHIDGDWHVESSFFGGRVASFVRIPGPNLESWSWKEIRVPLKSRDWLFDSGTITVPLNPRIIWDDLKRIVPSIKCEVKTRMRPDRASTMK